MPDIDWGLFNKYESLEIPFNTMASLLFVSEDQLNEAIVEKFKEPYDTLHKRTYKEKILSLFGLFRDYIEKAPFPLIEDFCQLNFINESMIENNREILEPLMKLCETKRLANLKLGGLARRIDTTTAHKLIDEINKNRGEKPSDTHFTVSFKK